MSDDGEQPSQTFPLHGFEGILNLLMVEHFMI